jgi:hypothetical protein
MKSRRHPAPTTRGCPINGALIEDGRHLFPENPHSTELPARGCAVIENRKPWAKAHRLMGQVGLGGTLGKTKGSGLFVVNHWALGERCKTKSPDPFVYPLIGINVSTT